MEDNNKDRIDDPGSIPLQLPVYCQSDAKFPGMFRVKRAKGKSFSSGGFGVAISVKKETVADPLDEKCKAEADKPGHSTVNGDPTSTCSEPTDKPPPNTTQQYLFLEEVLFLHEQGLLACQIGEIGDEASNSNNDDTTPQTILRASALYAMLKTHQVSMASYLVFAHLRQQTFRVLRYTTNRLALLRQRTEEEPATATTTTAPNTTTPSKRNILLQLRLDVQEAPPPFVIDRSTTTEEPQFAFCVYNPDSTFSKSNPGLPDFLVAVTVFGQPSLDYAALQDLITKAEGIPIKLATVADSGAVVMFGITDYGVPPL